MKKKSIISMIIIPCIAVCILIFTLYNNLHKNNAVEADSVLRDLNGTMQTIHFEEKPTILLFFTSWCPYCNEDAPKVVSLFEKYKNEINLYGINLQNRDNPDDLKAYIDKHKIQYPVLLDAESSLYKKYGSPGFPMLVLLDQKGKVSKKLVGSREIDVIERLFKIAI